MPLWTPRSRRLYAPTVVTTAWSPANLFAGTSGLFWDFTDATALRANTDGSGAAPAANNDAAKWVQDKSGNGFNGSSSTGSPVYQTGSGRPFVQFAAGTIFNISAANAGTILKNRAATSVVAGYRTQTIINDAAVTYAFDGTVPHTNQNFIGGGDVFNWNAPVTPAQNRWGPAGISSLNPWRAHVVQTNDFQGGQARFYVDTAEYSGTGGSFSAAGTFTGGSNSGTSGTAELKLQDHPSAVNDFYFFLVIARLITAQDRSDLWNWSQARMV